MVKDYNNIEYKTVTSMCRAHGVSTSTYNNKIKAGLSVKEALTGGKSEVYVSTKVTKDSPFATTDHLGNLFESQKTMCVYYNIKYATYKNRLNRGYSLEKALTADLHPNKSKPRKVV